MVNPHWDETINEDEDIGFRGPHFNAPSRSPQQEWGDVGGGGEFSGSRREEVLPSPNMPGSWRGGDEGWGNYPADEFTGIQSHIPSGRTGVLQKLFGLLVPQMAGLYGGRKTPSEIRQDAINWGREAGLGNRISFAGEGGRDILNPNEMRVNAPSVEGWKQRAQRKMWMDRMYQEEDNPYYDQDWFNGGDVWW